MAGPTEIQVLRLFREHKEGLTVEEIRTLNLRENLRLPANMNTVLYVLTTKGWLRSVAIKTRKRWHITQKGLDILAENEKEDSK